MRFLGVVTLRTCVTAGVRLYVAIGEPEIMVECLEPAELVEPARPCRLRSALYTSADVLCAPCADVGRFGSLSSTGVRAPFILPKERLLASLRRLVWPSKGEDCSLIGYLRAEVEELRLETAAEEGVFEGILAIGGR